MSNPINDNLFQEAREWFNGMNPDSRNQMILVLYKLCISTRDLSHEKLINSLNTQWNEKFNKQIEYTKQLTIENEILTKNQQSGISLVMDKIKDLETNINNSVNGLSSKITPSSNGKLGEDYIDHLLSKIPGASFTNVTQTKGGGDFLLILNDIQIMIESKNWTNSSIKGNPKELELFRKTAIEAKEERNIDFAIMALHRVTDIKGRPMEIEIEMTKKGTLMLLYVTNLFNHPERLLYAIDAGILLLKQQSQQTINKDKFIYQINSFLKGIDNIEESIKERQRIIKDLTNLSKKDSEHMMSMKQMLDNILNNTEQIPIRDRVINFYCELIKSHGQKITKSMLETKCLENKIPARYVRELGGIKAIRSMALEKMKSGQDKDYSETNEEIDSENDSNSEPESKEELDPEIEEEEESE